MRTYAKVFEDPNWFLKVTITGTSNDRSESYTDFADEAAIDTYLNGVITSLAAQQTNHTTLASDLGTEIAALTILVA